MDPLTRHQSGDAVNPDGVCDHPAPPPAGAPGRPDLLVFTAGSFDDAEAVITAVRGGRSVVLNAAGLPETSGQRLVDFVCGGISAMDGQIHRIGDGVFLVAPALTRVAEDGFAAAEPAP